MLATVAALTAAAISCAAAGDSAAVVWGGCEIDHVPELWRLGVAGALSRVHAQREASAAITYPVLSTPVSSFDLQRDGHVYEVGVFTGNSMVTLQQELDPPMIWGFDSFEGLPVSMEEHVSEWHEGKYSDDPRDRLRDVLGGPGRHGWVQGYYSDSLGPSRDGQVTSRGMRPARYIDIDCDLYESTRDALDFFFRNGLAVAGTVIGYDDWWVLPCGQGNKRDPLAAGEGRAHVEAAAKYGVTFRCVAGSCFDAWNEDSGSGSGGGSRDLLSVEQCRQWLETSSWGAMFEVVSVDGHRAASVGSRSVPPPTLPSPDDVRVPAEQHGFFMGPSAVARFVATNANCRSIWSDGAIYTLKGAEALAAEAEALARGHSGVKVELVEPREGASWQHAQPVTIAVDVTEVGVDADDMRRNPGAFVLCYAATPTVAVTSGAAEAAALLNGFTDGRTDQFQPPTCYPLQRGGAALAPLVMPESSRAGAMVWAWIEERSAGADDSFDAALLQKPLTAAKKRIGLTFVRLGQPSFQALVQSPQNSIDNDSNGMLPRRRQRGDLENLLVFASKGNQSNSEIVLKLVEEVVDAGARGDGAHQRAASSATPLLRITSPLPGTPWHLYGAGGGEGGLALPVSVEVDASVEGAGAALLRADPGAFDLCLAAGSGATVTGRSGGESWKQGSEEEEDAASAAVVVAGRQGSVETDTSPGDTTRQKRRSSYCVPLLSMPPELPGLLVPRYCGPGPPVVVAWLEQRIDNRKERQGKGVVLGGEGTATQLPHGRRAVVGRSHVALLHDGLEAGAGMQGEICTAGQSTDEQGWFGTLL